MKMRGTIKLNRLFTITALMVAPLITSMSPSLALPSTDEPAPIEARSEGQGPYKRLILRGGYMIDGTGAPAQGPVDIVVENDRIKEIRVVGAPGGKIKPENRPALDGGEELDISGMYIMPGFVDSHLHIHSEKTGQGVPPEYIMKLWLAHGITSGRTNYAYHGTPWEMKVKRKLDSNEILGPRIHVYPAFDAPEAGPLLTEKQARDRIRNIKKMGGAGVKFFGAPLEIMTAALDEASKQGLNSTMHHAQLDVMHANVLTTSKLGLKSMEHWYGLPEAMFEDRTIQHYPNDYIYNDEQHRFGEAGRLWKQAAKPGSPKWNAVMDTLLERDFAMSPTFTAYLTSRDFMRMSRAEWHEEYTMPALWEFYRASRNAHGSYWFNWSIEDEVEWKNNYRLWMQFVNDYKNKGGRVIIGSDSGYIYNLYGFGYVQEMLLLREAGFTPLEVLHAATMQGAKQLGIDKEVGSIRVGKKADFVIVDENPLANLRVLHGTGAYRLNDETDQMERIGGIDYTVKDGIVYNAKALLKSVRDMVKAEKDRLGIAPGIMPIATAGE
ncbi:MAG: amidohydrolase family protein [Kordiimonas sp.]